MASRTNKSSIAKKKQQQAKQKKLLGERKVDTLGGQKKIYTNPIGHEHKRFGRSGKRVCDATGQREDPDGYRIIRRPNSGEIEFVHNPQGWGYRRWSRRRAR